MNTENGTQDENITISETDSSQERNLSITVKKEDIDTRMSDIEEEIGSQEDSLFKNEIMDLVENLTPQIITIEQTKEITEDIRTEIMRELHSAKGAANLSNNAVLAELLHSLESVFKHRNLELFLEDSTFFNLIFETFDILTNSVIDEYESEHDVEAEVIPIIEAFENIITTKQIDSLQKISEAFPGIPSSVHDFLTEQQEDALTQQADKNNYVFVIEVLFELDSFIDSSKEFHQILNKFGRIISCTGAECKQENKTRFIYILATELPETELTDELESFDCQVFDARTATNNENTIPSEQEAGKSRSVLPKEKQNADEKAEEDRLEEEKKREFENLIEKHRIQYLDEFPEKVDTFNTLVSNLEQDKENEELIDDIFRFAHSLKGVTGSLGFPPLLTQLGGRLEDVLSLIRSSKISVSESICELFYEWIDCITEVLEKLQTDTFDESLHPPILQKLEKLKNTEGTSTPAVRESSKVKKAEDTSPATKTSKPVSSVLRRDDDTIRVDISKVDSIINTSGELVNLKSELMHLQKEILDALDIVKSDFRDWKKKYEKICSIPEFRQLLRHKEIKEFLEFSKDTLKNSLEQMAVVFELDEQHTSELSVLVDRLSDEAMQIRMLPVRTLFQRFPRMVRDISRSLGHEVNLEIYGEDTEIDKHILEQLDDSLTHMIRNSIDHGIEPPEVREEKGKDRQGTIILSAYHQKNWIIIEVSDDGAGLSVEKIGSKAVESGLITQDEFDDMTEQEIFNLIFTPGFTTKSEATNLSGRGVGMDVVQTNISQLQGQVGVRTVKDEGTTFLLKLPLTLSIQQALMLRDNGAIYCIPSISVREIIYITQEDIEAVGGGFAVMYRDEVLPVVSLRGILGTGAGLLDKDKIPVLVLYDLQRRVGIAVETVESEEEIVIKPLGSILKKVENVSGVTILVGGQIAVVLDATSIIRNAKRALGTELLFSSSKSLTSAETVSKIKDKKNILVVEDSATSREMIMNILELADYKVSGAVNGNEAWEKMDKHSFHLVVTDVDMPMMDGLELTRKIRSSDEYVDLPVIMVTALGKDEERRQGLEAGANAYIVKKSFDQGTLLARVRELIG